MKKVYMLPELELICSANTDVLTSSPYFVDTDNREIVSGDPFLPRV